MLALAQGPQEPGHLRVLAQGPQDPAHLRVLALAQGPQGPAPLQVKEPAQKPRHLRVRELLRVRLMESPQLGEQLESRPEAVLFPHLHQQNPQGPREPAHLQDQEPVRVKWEVIWEPEPLVLQAQVPQFPPAEPLGQEAQGRLPAVLAVLEVVPRSC